MNVDFPTPGTPEMPTRTVGECTPTRLVLGERGQQLAGLLAVPRAGRLDERDRLRDRGPVARADALDELLDARSRHQWSELLPQLGQEVECRLGDDRAGQEHRGRAHLLQRRDVVGRDDAADHDHDVVAAGLGQRRLQRRQQREVARRERRDADDVHVVVDRLLGDLLGRGEQRPHVDVEAHVGERRDDHLLAAVVAVLAHLGDQDARTPSLGLGELGGRVEDLRRRGAARRVSRTRLVPEHSRDRTDHGLVTPVDLLQRVGDLADRGLRAGRVDRQREQVAVERVTAARPGLGASWSAPRACGVPRRRPARRAAARAWRSAGGRRRRCRPAARRACPRRRAGRC